jgi:hypothetical protein
MVRAIEQFAASPRPGKLCSLYGSRNKSILLLEGIEGIEQLVGHKTDWCHLKETRRNHFICYISNPGKFQSQYPFREFTRGLGAIPEHLVTSEKRRNAAVQSR